MIGHLRPPSWYANSADHSSVSTGKQARIGTICRLTSLGPRASREADETRKRPPQTCNSISKRHHVGEVGILLLHGDVNHGSNPCWGAKLFHYDCLSLLVNWLFAATAQIGAILLTSQCSNTLRNCPEAAPGGQFRRGRTTFSERLCSPPLCVNCPGASRAANWRDIANFPSNCG